MQRPNLENRRGFPIEVKGCLNRRRIMLRILLIIASVMILSCESVCVDCRCIDSTVRGQWVLDCVKNGNNMSDEEMEDVVRQCMHASESLFCGRARCRMKLMIADNRAEWLEEPKCDVPKIEERVGNADADK